MSRDWTPEETRAASEAMKRAGQMSYEEVCAEVEAKEKIDRFASVQSKYHWPCPRCGKWSMNEKPSRNALSRRVNVYICDLCGSMEALEDLHGTPIGLRAWDIARHEEWPFS